MIIRLSDIFSAPHRLIQAAACFAALAFTGCSDSFIFDEEGDCDPYYKVHFLFDYNMLYTDAFPQQVGAVTLYVADTLGNIVWQKTEAGEALKSGDYLMEIDNKAVAPGRYTLMAWAGEGHNNADHFTIANAARHTDLTCSLTRSRAEAGHAYRQEHVERLFHGKPVEVELPSTQGVHVYDMPLIKNTNDLHVVLQHLSGEPVEPDKFNFSVTADNGTMAHDNSLIPDETIHYLPHEVRSGNASIYFPQYNGNDASRATVIASPSTTMAHLSFARLVKGNDIRLHITNAATGDTIASVPVTDYALLTKDFDAADAGHPEMTDQEYLDRKDNYSMVFFLDEGMRWISSQIIINSWHIVRQSTDL